MRLLQCILTISIAALGYDAVGAERIDAQLWAEIAKVKAIDHHSHADPADPARGSTWDRNQPLGTSRYPDVMPLRHDDANWSRAWTALYGYRHKDVTPEHAGEALDAKRRLLKEKGESWPVHVLDKSGIEIAFVNTTRLGAGQQSARFRWVPYADSLLWPFDGDKLRMRFAGPGGSIAELMKEVGVVSSSASLESYVENVIDPVLRRYKSGGAVAVKFMTAYARAIDFTPVPVATVAPIYAKAAAGTSLSVPEVKSLEDYLFNEVAARAGKVGLVVHIHTGNGDGPYFNNGNANPALLEAALNSRALRQTNFVLVHGGWPFHAVAQAMIDKPNTYLDFSAETFYLTPHALARVLREWLGWHPEKVMFGTDAYSDENSPLSDYEEKQWLLTDNARKALAIALTAMMDDGEINRARAVEIAKMVLRENARVLYKL